MDRRFFCPSESRASTPIHLARSEAILLTAKTLSNNVVIGQGLLYISGVFVHAQMGVVAPGIAAEIAGREVSGDFPGIGYCMRETGFTYGNFLTELSPQIELHTLGKSWHTGKVLFEPWWLSPYGLKRETLRLAMALGDRWMGIPRNI